MPKGYHHLTYDQRCQIYTLKGIEKSLSEIASITRVHRSSITRELKRNADLEKYHYVSAQEKSTIRKSKRSIQRPVLNESMKAIIESEMRVKYLSPQQIAGRLKRQGQSISHETIYKYIWEDKKKNGDLYNYLRRKGKKYQKRGKLIAGRGLIPHRVDIDKRPQIVDRKIRFGDFEVDTIIGTGQSGAIVSIVDRASKLTKLGYVFAKTAEDVGEMLLRKLMPLKNIALTITADNGKEFAHHQKISSELGVEFYFAKPYQSWQRGLNEHTNGLIRQFFPKDKRFDEISDLEIQTVEDLLNNRPRKVLNYETPLEVFNRLSFQTPLVALQG